VSNVTLSLSSGGGWTSSTGDIVSLLNIAVDSTAHVSWTVTPKAPGVWYQPPGIVASFSINNESAQKSLPAPIFAPILIDQARNNIGISNDTAVTAGNFDGSKNSYSAQALAAAGLEPGAQFQAGGITFTWPNVTLGYNDNILSLGQTILVNGTGNTLGFVGASTNAYNGGIGTIFYADGSSSQFTLELGNYLDTQFLQNTVIVTTPYVNSASGPNHQKTGTLFYYGIPLVHGKSVLAVTLPATNTITSVNPTSGLHIFAVALG
jgi:hypothetical protein